MKFLFSLRGIRASSTRVVHIKIDSVLRASSCACVRARDACAGAARVCGWNALHGWCSATEDVVRVCDVITDCFFFLESYKIINAPSWFTLCSCLT